ncbi:MAG TPA: DNA helicase RecQ [Caldilineae bacterium]|nr:DNA helicase RecQ [Caldilineae bacterium]
MSRARRLLKDVFGFDEFLPLQAEIIANILQRRDTLVIMPTGGGKSLCYQLPALLSDGLTVVVSPLIALMQDQVDALRQLGVAAAFLNSTLSMGEYTATVGRIRAGEIKLLYVAPETLLRPETLVMLDQSRVQLFAIDEAHCISSWGHDFRPEYRQLLPVRRRYARAVCLALTATATPRVQQDIEDMLGFDASNRFVASFDRVNLHLAVQPRLDGLRQTLEFLEAHREQAGIIYCTTRRQVDELAAQLQAQGWSALPYHAGLDSAVRQRHQRQFVLDEAAIIVATVAFGMGIDKSNVRFILHYNLPGNIERYYQEIGRAGRDGLRADCLLLFSQSDVGSITYFIEQGAESERPGRQVRLQAMVRYAQSDECRRRPLLAYLGETYEPENCGMCDNCLTEKQEQELDDVTIEAQMFLSCVKRTGERFGVTHIIKVLRGSRDKAVLTRRHDRLSTYGIGAEIPTREWKRLAQAFIQQKLMEQDMQFGGLRLTPKAYAVFRGEKVMVVGEQKPIGPEAQAGLAHDALLFEALRILRKQVAGEAQVPPYVIFSDRSLVEMATYFPQSDGAFLAIYGVGQRKLAAHGERFMALIRDYCAEHDCKERPRPGSLSPASRPGSTKKRRYQEVGELFTNGYEIEELQNLYNVKQSTIISHLYRFHRTGGDLDAERILPASGLPPEQQQRVLAALDELGPDRLGSIYDALRGAVAYDELHVLRLYYVSGNR